MVGIFEADQRDRGRGRGASRRRAERRKVVRLYDVLLGREGEDGWLDALLAETDAVGARRLAGAILEFDRAIMVEGHPAFSTQLPEHVPAISVLPWSIPGSTQARDARHEASNLVDPATGQFLEAEEIAQLIRDGGDPSRLEPPSDSPFWRARPRIASLDVVRVYRADAEGPPVYHGLEKPFPERVVLKKLRTTQTKPKFEVEMEVAGKRRKYKLKVGAEIHSEPVTGALLTVLGFNADLVKHVKDFRVDLGNLTEEEIRREWRSYFEFERTHQSFSIDDYFVFTRDGQGPYMLAREASLTAYPDEAVRVGPWYWGQGGNDGLREVRGLSLFNIWVGNVDVKEGENNKLLLRTDREGPDGLYYMVHDLGHSFGRVFGEQLKHFPWDVASRTLSRRIRFDYYATWVPTIRNHATFADARWMVRQIAQLTRAQIEAAVALGDWPDAVAQLLVEKLIQRRNGLVETLGLEGEETPSGPIALLPVDRRLTTSDGAVVDGELVTGVFEGSTKEFANYYDLLFGPVLEKIQLLGVGAVQGTLGSVPAIIFDDESSGISKFVVLELQVALERKVRENPRPRSADDFYLVQDRVKLGLRVGGGLVARATTAFWRSYTLVRPAASEREARFADDRIMSLVRRDVKRGALPDEFVLIRQSYLDGRLGFITESFSGKVPLIGGRGGASRVNLGRSVVARRDGDLRLWRDESDYHHRDLEAFLNLLFVHYPAIRSERDEGSLRGELWTVPFEEVEVDPTLAGAVDRALRDDDFGALETLRSPLPLSSAFDRAVRWFRVPLFFGRGSSWRRERVAVHDPSSPGTVRETLHQLRRDASGYWAFLDWGEDFRHVIRSTFTAGGTKRELTPAIVSTYYQRDRDTYDAELGDAYLGFIDGLARRDEPTLRPSLHSYNGRWGDLEVKVRIGYSRKAVERLGELDLERFWTDLAAALGIHRGELEGHRASLAGRGPRRFRGRYRLPARLLPPILRAERVVERIAAAREADDPEVRLRLLTESLGEASYRRGGGYDPTLLVVLHQQLGRKQVSIDATIQPPPFEENRLIGRTPIRIHTRKEPRALAREPLDLDPQCAPAVWEMLETFPTWDGQEIRWPEHPPAGSGSPCDGSWGPFAR
ncbi:MAG: hypothetical protein GY937_12015 [bacterium]|nr:hypothetical protein [bacterium]